MKYGKNERRAIIWLIGIAVVVTGAGLLINRRHAEADVVPGVVTIYKQDSPGSSGKTDSVDNHRKSRKKKSKKGKGDRKGVDKDKIRKSKKGKKEKGEQPKRRYLDEPIPVK